MLSNYYTDKVAVVVGASSGIGYAVAEQLSRAGARVVAVGRNNQALETLQTSLQKAGLEIATKTADIRDVEPIKDIIDGVVKTHGGLDLIYNGAGYGLVGYCEETSLKHWEQMFATTVRGLVHGVHTAYNIMCKQGYGQIVNVASLAGLIPLPASTAYVAAKHAVVGLSLSLRLEASRYGVKVSVVCPAAVDTPAFDSSRAQYVNINKEKFLASRQGGILTPEACAKKILKGIRKNRAIIVPGPARIIWWLYRFAPIVWTLMRGRFMKAIKEAHIATEEELPEVDYRRLE